MIPADQNLTPLLQRLGLSLVGILLLPLLGLTCSCSAAPRPPLQTPGNAAAEPATLADARAALVAARERVAGLEAQQSAERQEAQQRLLAWATGVALLASIACTALAIFLPVMRKRMALGAAACGAVVLLSQALSVALPWLPLVGAVLALAALVSGLLLAVRALRSSIGLAEALKQISAPTAATALLDAARAAQRAAGTHKAIAAIRARVSLTPAHQQDAAGALGSSHAPR